MFALVLCFLAFLFAYLAARRGIVPGLVAVLVVGYLYGILRANVPQTFSHFIFDAAAGGFYVATFSVRASAQDLWRTRTLRSWMLLLIGWPAILLLIPVQDPLVQLVGLRGAVFMLPFIVVGARLSDGEMRKLAYAVAVLNLCAFGVAIAEYVIGLEPFFPRNAVTELIYRSKDVAGQTAYRIPSTFTSAHGYAATMAATSAMLVGLWMHTGIRYRLLLGVSAVVSVIGVFMAAARTHMLVLAIVLVVATLSGQVRLGARIGWLLSLILIGGVISQSERLQRFRTIDSTEVVSDRLEGSVNANFVRLATEYPLGNGLGGGGTSLPYFLMNRVRDPIGMENEYARIMLEQGIPGLIIWVAFLGWVFVRSPTSNGTRFPVLARLYWVLGATYFASAVSGTGLLTAVPLTAILLLYVGWLCARPGYAVAAQARAVVDLGAAAQAPGGDLRAAG
jgi:hypothetical protein